ncbi:MAG: cyclodeaminase/cyclohydrolase family protein [Candidatus Omnitrophota bacterium]
MKQYADLTIRNYIQNLGDKSIVPGGGSAAALSGAVGAGLNLMVINYSIPDKEDASYAKELLDIRNKQEKCREELYRLIDEDCRVFTELMDALRTKDKDVQKKYVNAANVPMQICRECAGSMKTSEYLAEKGNKNLMTDVICAAAILKGAFVSAKVNVVVNLKHIKDMVLVSKIEEELEILTVDIESRERRIVQ